MYSKKEAYHGLNRRSKKPCTQDTFKRQKEIQQSTVYCTSLQGGIRSIDIESLESAGDIYEIREWVSENDKIGDVHLFNDWTELIETKATPDEHWLRNRIIPAIQEALTQLDKDKVK